MIDQLAGEAIPPHLHGSLDGIQRLRAAVPVRGLDEPGRDSGQGGGRGGGARRRTRGSNRRWRPATKQTCGPGSGSGNVLFAANAPGHGAKRVSKTNCIVWRLTCADIWPYRRSQVCRRLRITSDDVADCSEHR